MYHSLEGIIELDDWWGDESALIKRDSLLSILKFAIIDALLDTGILENKDLDNRNMTSHIKLTTKLSPRNQIVYNSVNGKKISIQLNDIRIGKDLIELNFKGPLSQFHMTIVYKKLIGDKRQQIMSIIAKVFEDLYRFQVQHNKLRSDILLPVAGLPKNNLNPTPQIVHIYPKPSTKPLVKPANPLTQKQESSTAINKNTELINKLISEVCVLKKQLNSKQNDDKTESVSNPSENNTCVVCFSKERNCCFVPCGHLCTCYDCAKSITDNKCPICRAVIKEKVKTFVS